ncbi:MAG: GTPase, partial [Burkholderiales bacterium]
RRRSLPETVRDLASAESRTAAYDSAVFACNADGAINDLEKEFLQGLAIELNLPSSALNDAQKQVDSTNLPVVVGGTASTGKMSDAELDKMIVDASVLNGALELMPETLSTMAIIPLQMRLVYRIGKSFGYEMDQSYIKDFIATLGVGLTSQYLEVLARKILGGVFGGIGRQAASSGMSFGVTYALGQVAKQYYAGGRKLDSAELKGMFSKIMADAATMKDNYAQTIQTKISEMKGKSFSEITKG